MPYSNGSPTKSILDNKVDDTPPSDDAMEW
jgi:hypothetical protein